LLLPSQSKVKLADFDALYQLQRLALVDKCFQAEHEFKLLGPMPRTLTNSTSYDAADANKDGVVTQLEQAAYNAKHLAKSTAASNSTATEALKAYQS
jgi:hypothetical protein